MLTKQHGDPLEIFFLNIHKLFFILVFIQVGNFIEIKLSFARPARSAIWPAKQAGLQKYLSLGVLNVELFPPNTWLLWLSAIWCSANSMKLACESNVCWERAPTDHTGESVGAELYEPTNQSNELKLAEICNKLKTGVLTLSGTGCISPFALEMKILLNVNIKNLTELYCKLLTARVYPLVLTEQTGKKIWTHPAFDVQAKVFCTLRPNRQ